MKNYSILFRVAAVLWVIWGAVHILAGVLTVSSILSDNIAGAIAGIADAIDASTLQMDYPKAAGAIIGQHGFNLLWIGIIH